MAFRNTLSLGQFATLAVLGSALAACGGDAAGKGQAALDLTAPYTQPCEGFSTGWDGDSQCILAPAPDEGFQLHYGPSTYDDPDEVAKYTMPASDDPATPKIDETENTDCVFRKTPNTEEVLVNEYYARLRPHTHHMITYAQPGTPVPDSVAPEACNLGAGTTFLVGATTISTDITTRGPDVAPEDKGLALRIQPATQVAVQMHYVNTTGKPLLKEGWINVAYLPKDEFVAEASAIEWLGGLNMKVPPKTTQVIQGSAAFCVSPKEKVRKRILKLVAHSHANTRRVAAYHTSKATGVKTKVYETFDWSDPGFMTYSNAVANPEPNADTNTTGGTSGQLWVEPTDTMSWECEVHNEWDNITLSFSDKAYEGEMCNMFGVFTPTTEAQPWSCYSP